MIVYCRVSSNFHFSFSIILCLVQKKWYVQKIPRGGWSGFGKALIWIDPNFHEDCLDWSKLFYLYPNSIQTGGVVQFCHWGANGGMMGAMMEMNGFRFLRLATSKPPTQPLSAEPPPPPWSQTQEAWPSWWGRWRWKCTASAPWSLILLAHLQEGWSVEGIKVEKLKKTSARLYQDTLKWYFYLEILFVYIRE